MNFSGAAGGLERVFGVVLEATALGSILILLVALLQWLSRKRLGPSWRFALWGIVVVRLLAPIAPESRWSVFNAMEWFARERVEPSVTLQVEPTILLPEDAGVMVEAKFPNEAPALTRPESAPRAGGPLVMLIGGAVWAAGMIWSLGRLLIGTWWLGRRIRAEQRATHGGRLETVMASAATTMGMKRIFRIVETGMVSSPALFGIFRPQLLVPTEFAEKLSAQELRHVLLHELAHLKRGDLITNWLMALAQAVHWFNPLVWLALRQMRMERELACDEMVLRTTCGEGEEESRAYGQTILRLLEGVSQRRNLPALVGIAEEKHSARKRILQIASFDGRRRGLRALGMVLVAILGVGGLTNAQSELAARSMDAGAAAKSINDARLLMEMGRLNEAEHILKGVLKGEPEHRAAIYYSRLIEERRAAQKERKELQQGEPQLKFLPSGERQASSITIADRRLNGEDLEAREAELREALKANPNDSSAVALLVELKEKRFAAEANKREVYGEGRVRGGRAEVMKKLNELKVDYYEVSNGLPLTEVIKDIHRLARKLDPEKKGVNFIVSSRLDKPAEVETGSGFDPLSGRPAPGLRAENYSIKISPALRDVTMVGLLDAIVEVAEPPAGNEGRPRLIYSVEDYGIVFAVKQPEGERLFTRTFKPVPNAFLQGKSAREFFKAAGIDFGEMREFNAQAGGAASARKAIFYNDRTEVLMVRATMEDLKNIELVLQTLVDGLPKQVLFEVNMVEVKNREEFDKLFRALGEKRAKGLGNRKEFETALTTLEIRAIEQGAVDGGFFWMKLPRVSTVVGRPARIVQEKLVSVDLQVEFQENEKIFKVTASSSDPKDGKVEAQEAVVFDGQTMVLLPKLDGDSVKPQRVIFITPRLIDGAGNWINTDDFFLNQIQLEVPKR